jgi:putative N6-adenine-specific DNA methylase
MIAADRAPGLHAFGFRSCLVRRPGMAALKERRATACALPPARHSVASNVSAGAIARTQSTCGRRRSTSSFGSDRSGSLSRAAGRPAFSLQSAVWRQAGGSERLARFYPLLGDALKQRFPGWTAYFFSGDLGLPKRFRKWRARHRSSMARSSAGCSDFRSWPA